MTKETVGSSTGNNSSPASDPHGSHEDWRDDLANWRFRRERQLRLYFSTAVVSILVGTAILYAQDKLYFILTGSIIADSSSSSFRSIYTNITFSGISLIAVGIFAGMFLYLQTGFKRSSDIADFSLTSASGAVSNKIAPSISREDISAIVTTTLSPLQAELATLRKSTGVLDESARADLVRALKLSVTQEAAASIIAELEAKIASASQREISERDFHERIRETRIRLLDEAKALQRRGNLNLAFGGTVTIAALYVLWTTVSLTMAQHETKWSDDPWSLVIHFGPRLTLALFLQVFAYFFLKLYKSSLSEIKYYQNELTNIETKQLAVNAALRSDGTDLLKEVVTSLLATERNHILTKDQTTVELEKARLDKDQKSEIFKNFTELFNKKG